jgi:hypothetical protein
MNPSNQNVSKKKESIQPKHPQIHWIIKKSIKLTREGHQEKKNQIEPQTRS